MTSTVDTSSTALAYCAVLKRLSEILGTSWIERDWIDRQIYWRLFRPKHSPSVKQGWKVHVSASAAECSIMLATVMGTLAQLQIPFKLPRRIDDVVFLNSGDAGKEQLGKIITIYPPDDECARKALVQIDRSWPISQGPEVQTDLHFRPRSAVSFRYGVFQANAEVVGSTGTHEFAFVNENGALTADVRLLQGKQSSFSPPPPMPGYPPTAHWIKLNEPLQVGKSEFIALMLLSNTAKACTFLAANIDTLETVVLKAGCQGVAGDATGRDIRDLLGREFTFLQELQVLPGVAPRALDWIDQDWPVLIMEDFRGTHLNELARRSRIECLPLLADAIAAVHEMGFVHGDIKLENTIRHRTGVGLIDFELAARIGELMRPAGTRGYIAPEVIGICAADTARDVFALAGCVVQAVLNIPLALLPSGTKRLTALLRNEGATEVAHHVEPWLNSNPYLRKNAQEVATTLHANVDNWRMLQPRAGSPSTGTEMRWYRRASSDAAFAARLFTRSDKRGTCWRNEHFMHPFECEAINVGAAGIILALVSIDTALKRTDQCRAVDQGAHWLTVRSAEGKAAGVFTGNAGVALALTVAGIRQGNATYLAAARRRFEAAVLDKREIDLFSGGAGVIWAACLLRSLLGEDWPLDTVSDTVAHLGQRAMVVSNVPMWAVESERDVTFFGCAHGSAGIAMALACWGQASGETAFTNLARETFRSLVRYGRTTDTSALRIGPHDARHHAVGNWCHGVAGYLWAILNGLGDDPALRDEIDWAVKVLSDEMSVGTSTYCHGLSGQLELWHMLEAIPRFRLLAQARSGKVARALRLMHVKVDGRCVWVSDNPEIITPDLWIGFLGPATALAMHAANIRDSMFSSAWLKACAEPSFRVPSGTCDLSKIISFKASS